MRFQKNNWDCVYKKAIQDDGTLFFPERLTEDFLERAKRTMGSFLFSNQYQNEIIPDDEQTFKKHWVRFYAALPDLLHTFAFIDPAISQADTADYTGICVVSVDCLRNWYVRYAVRQRLNPTQLIDLCFRLCDQYPGLRTIGIEDVAFQRAIIHFAQEEMRRRNRHIPITGVKRGPDITKEMRILSLVPRFEWGTLFLTQGMHDLELELGQFPRGAHDDVLDALSSIENVVFYPEKRRSSNEAPAPNSPDYERWYIQQLVKRSNNPE